MFNSGYVSFQSSGSFLSSDSHLSIKPTTVKYSMLQWYLLSNNIRSEKPTEGGRDNTKIKEIKANH